MSRLDSENDIFGPIVSDDNDSTIMAIGNNNMTSSSKEEERVELDVPSRMAPMPPPGKKGGIGKSLSSMIKDEDILLSSIPTPTSRERMSFDLQQRLEGQVTSQKMRIEELEEEIAQKSQLLDILKSGLKTYKSYGARKPSKTQREMDFMFMSGKNPPSLPATKVRALVFDCGTSETKALLYTYTNNSKGCDISLEEVYLDNEAKGTKRPGVIEAIESGTIDDVVETFSNLYLQATKSDGKSKTHEMTGLDFCIVGASAWARKLYTNLKVNQDKNILLYELRENGLFPKIFPQSDESAFELLATLLAFTSGKKVGMIPMDFVFSGVLGSGGGSCQYTMRDEKGSYQSLLVEIGNREGRDTFIKSAKSNFKKDPKKSLKDLEDWVRDMKGKIELRKKEASKKFTFRKVKGFVLCISAQYYAAGEMCKVLKGCKETYGNFCNKDNKTETISAGLAVQAAEKYLKQQKKRWLEMSVSEREALVSDKKKLKNFALGLANVSICSTFWSLYFENSAVLCFKRDWEIGGAKYRNTWSAGWFIDILRAQKNIDLTKKYPEMKSVMDLLTESRENMDKKTTHFRLTHSKVAFYVNDMVKSHIACIPEMATYIREVAKAKSKETDNWIRYIETELQKMKGATKKTSIQGLGFHIKGQHSLERKLDSAIAALLLKHAPFVGDGSYAPLEATIIQKIRDCLRYTLVIDEEIYYRGVRLVEDFFIKKNCEIEAKNFWQDPPRKQDRKTMYMGLNMHIWLAPDPIAHSYKESRFPVELQIHTPASFDLKSHESHAIYEDIRTENVLARRDKLVEKAYKLWEDMNVPRDPTLNPVSFAEYEGMKKGTFKDCHKRYESRRKIKARTKKSGGPKTCAFCRQALPHENVSSDAKDVPETKTLKTKVKADDEAVHAPKGLPPGYAAHQHKKKKNAERNDGMAPEHTVDTFFSAL